MNEISKVKEFWCNEDGVGVIELVTPLPTHKYLPTSNIPKTLYFRHFPN